jgi:hypothetical protein
MLTPDRVCNPRWIGLTEEVAVFRHVDSGQGMQSQVDTMPSTGLLDRFAARVAEALHGIGATVELDIDVIHLVPGSPFEPVLERRAPADVHADAVLQVFGHTVSPGVRS